MSLPKFLLFALILLIVGVSMQQTARGQNYENNIVVLVAKPALRDRLYGATVLVVRPIGNGHFGFIVNKPTQVTLSKLFPDHAPSRKVTEPVFLGGPVNTEVLFVLVRRDE